MLLGDPMACDYFHATYRGLQQYARALAAATVRNDLIILNNSLLSLNLTLNQ